MYMHVQLFTSCYSPSGVVDFLLEWVSIDVSIGGLWNQVKMIIHEHYTLQ